MKAISISIPPESLRQAKLKGLPRRLRRAHKQVLSRAATLAVKYAQMNFRDAGETTPFATVRRTGQLYKRYQWRPGTETESSVEVEWGIIQGAEPLRYARLQEFGTDKLPGGVLRATRSKFLAIPLDAMKTKRGVARTTARDAMEKAPRGFKSTFILRAKSGRLLIAGNKNNGWQRELLFQLVRKVQIKPRPSIAPTMRHIRPQVIEALQQATNEAINAPA